MDTPEQISDRRLSAVGIAGTGRIAQALGALLHQRGVAINAIAGRDRDRTLAAAEFTGASRAVAIEDLGRYADIVVMAVSDDAIPEIARQLAGGAAVPSVVLHTCGSAGPELLASLHDAGCATGVLHPLQTVPSSERGVQALSECFYAYCGDTYAQEWALRLIGFLGGRSIRLNPEHWALYHAAAVIACNYSVTLVNTALDLLEQAGVERRDALQALTPIIRNTTEILLSTTPEEALTGPVRRGDVGSVMRHLSALEIAPSETRELYRAAAKSTLTLARRAGLSEEAATKLADVLRQDQTL